MYYLQLNILKIDIPDRIIISRRTLGRLIKHKVNDVKTILKTKLKNKFVCTTADIWSTTSRSFMGITVHWVNI